jgi:murein DD-endopeptidase MepM/ murein hydrolase activator NlpD
VYNLEELTMKSTKIKQYSRFMMFLALTLTMVLGFIPTSYGNNTMDRLRSEQSQTRSGMEQVRDLRRRANAQRSDTLFEINGLTTELDELSESLEFWAEELSKAEAALEESEAKLEVAIEDRELQMDVLAERLRFMYLNKNVGYLDILAGASSISDFLNRVDYMSKIYEHDETMLVRLLESESKISDTVEKITDTRNHITAYRAFQEEASEKLEIVLNEKRVFIESLEANINEYETQIKALEAEDARITRLINNENTRLARQTTTAVVAYSGGRLTWPVPASSQVSSPFGSRINPINRRREHHNGLDIRAPHGSTVVAAEAGTVIFSGWMNGLGNTVIINHGNLTTLYAHHSRNIATEGQVVARGDTIARVGSTGYSTGNHLHFEVHVNGGRTDPMPYFRR